jgi:hypothetical protein
MSEYRVENADGGHVNLIAPDGRVVDSGDSNVAHIIRLEAAILNSETAQLRQQLAEEKAEHEKHVRQDAQGNLELGRVYGAKQEQFLSLLAAIKGAANMVEVQVILAEYDPERVEHPLEWLMPKEVTLEEKKFCKIVYVKDSRIQSLVNIQAVAPDGEILMSQSYTPSFSNSEKFAEQAYGNVYRWVIEQGYTLHQEEAKS